MATKQPKKARVNSKPERTTTMDGMTPAKGRSGARDRKKSGSMDGATVTSKGKDGKEEVLIGGPVTVNEDYVRRRIAEALRRDQASVHKIGLEILLLLPNDFIRQYEELFHKALMVGDEGSKTGKMGDESGKSSVKQPGNQSGMMSVGSGGGKKYRTYGFIANEQALALKQTIDKKLRRLAREMGEYLRGDRGEMMAEAMNCRGCSKYVEEGWKFCPSCGADLSSGEN